jgi:hypothetical protein
MVENFACTHCCGLLESKETGMKPTHFFKTCKVRFSLREESYKALQWENPKKRGNKKVTPEMRKE